MFETENGKKATATLDLTQTRVSNGRAAVRKYDESSNDAIAQLPADYQPPRRRPGRTDGITPRFENMLQEAQRAGFEAGYRAAFQALGLDAKAVRVLRVMCVREAMKLLPTLPPTDRIALLRRLDDMPPGDDD